MTTKAQELTKKQKRARNDARTAWRAMTPEQRAEFLAWAVDEAGPTFSEACAFKTSEERAAFERVKGELREAMRGSR